MAQVDKNVKNILKDVQEFLPHVKDSKLNPKAKVLKSNILQQIQQLQVDKADEGDDDPEILYEAVEKEDCKQELLKKTIPASDRQGLVVDGKLKYRKEKKTGSKVTYQNTKRWCALRGHIFYMYDASSSKKQKECFFVDGYQVTPIENEAAKKEASFPFEMVKTGEPTYVLAAATAPERDTWVKHLNQATGIARRERPLTVMDGIYDDMDSLVLDEQSPGSTYDATEPDSHPGGDPDAIYDATEPDSHPDDDPDAIYDATEPDSHPGDDPEEASGSWAPELPDRIAPSLIPAAQPETEQWPSHGPSPADLYYGVWDNAADHPQELEFRRGDLITVLSRLYEDKGWWVARLGGKVGLVPKDYLSPAYVRV